MPLVVAAFAGVINETIDRRLLRVILQPLFGAEEALAQVGIYGAVYKLSIILTLFTQAFRYAAEPFFFRTDEGSNKKTVYADMMKWYTIVALLASLLVLLFLDIFQNTYSNRGILDRAVHFAYSINGQYFSGLDL